MRPDCATKLHADTDSRAVGQASRKLDVTTAATAGPPTRKTHAAAATTGWPFRHLSNNMPAATSRGSRAGSTGSD